MKQTGFDRFLLLLLHTCLLCMGPAQELLAGHRQPASRLRPAQYLNPYHLKDVHIPTQLAPTVAPSSTPSSPARYHFSPPVAEHFPCRELIRQPLAAQIHCQCRRDEPNMTVELNCDHVRWPIAAQSLQLLPGQVLDSILLRHAGLQMLPGQLFSASTGSSNASPPLQLKQLDLSHNYLRRLSQRSFDGVEHSLQQLRLGHNLLGDQLNPIFATNEFFALKSLQLLDLSFNRLRAVDSNLFAGLGNLTVRFQIVLSALGLLWAAGDILEDESWMASLRAFFRACFRATDGALDDKGDRRRGSQQSLQQKAKIISTKGSLVARFRWLLNQAWGNQVEAAGVCNGSRLECIGLSCFDCQLNVV